MDFNKIINRRNTDSKKYNKYEDDVIPMWIAETDFRAPDEVVSELVKRAEHGVYGYVSNSENFNLSIKEWLQRRYKWTVDKDWIGYVPGVVPAIVNTIQTFTRENDSILIQTPVYHAFHEVIKKNDRRIVENQLKIVNGRYEIDFIDLKDKLENKNIKLMLLCNPHNPVGRVFTKDELKKIADMCLEYNVILFADEIHSDLVYKNLKHTPLLSISDKYHKNTICSLNPSKTFNLAGLRTGVSIIPDNDLRNKFKKYLRRNRLDGETIFGLKAFEIAYEKCDYYVDELVDYIESNKEFLKNYLLTNIPNIKLIEPESTYLMWLDFRNLGIEQNDLLDLLVNQAKIGLSDGEQFGSNGRGFMRMNIGCSKEVLSEALNRLESAIKSYFVK